MVSGKILLVDDDEEVSELTKYALSKEGYEVIQAFDGLAGLEKAREIKPDMIVLDIDMPRMNGLELCREIRSDKTLRLVPVVMLTGSRTHPTDKIAGIDIGADDYVLKPFEPGELCSRIKRLITRTKEQQSSNPLTGLPGSHTLKTEATKRIEKKEKTAVCYFDLDNFKAYNDNYGYRKGDEVIKSVAEIINRTSSKCGTETDCLTHIGGDDFVLLTHPEYVKCVCEQVITEFAGKVPGFYSDTDRSSGNITTVNRKGEKQTFPLMTISIACVTNETRDFDHFAHMADVLNEVKKYAKSIQGNIWVKDRRKDRVAA
jgi:diguanylate cyclase (GGDEF)-like protein